MKNKYNNLKIALIFGKGFENCGVERGAHELFLWGQKNKATVHLYGYNKKYSRAGAHNNAEEIIFKDKNIKEITEHINNNYDIVMFMSYPQNKFDHNYCKNFYHIMYKGITKPIKVMQVHDIHSGQIDKSLYLVSMIHNADMVFHFDTDTWFSKIVNELGLQKIGDRLNKYTLWINFDELKKFWSKEKTKGLVSVTRWSSLKNIGRTIEIQNHILNKHPKWNCKVYGVERSIGAKFDILDRPDITYVNPSGKKDGNGKVEVYGPISRNEGLTHIANSIFASSFFSLPKAPQNYGNRMEYTQIEIIGVGTIPVFDKHWAQNNKLSDGRYYYDIPYSAIYTDGTNTQEIAEQLIKLANQPDEQIKYLKTSFDLVYNEFNADTVIPKALDLIISKGKNPNQLSDYEICEKFANKEFADKVQELEQQGKIPCLGIGEFQKLEVYYLDEHKQKLYAKCKPKKVTLKKNADIKLAKKVTPLF
jgi:hypothetical protein